ncbi:MAG: right-handed parallel beta-helix repeat-containing protein [Planctomycetota bacterium]|jgi:hypothetical protein
MKTLAIIILLLITPVAGYATVNVYVDPDCSDVTTYVPSTGACTGGSDRVYDVIQDAVDYVGSHGDLASDVFYIYLSPQTHTISDDVDVRELKGASGSEIYISGYAQVWPPTSIVQSDGAFSDKSMFFTGSSAVNNNAANYVVFQWIELDGNDTAGIGVGSDGVAPPDGLPRYITVANCDIHDQWHAGIKGGNVYTVEYNHIHDIASVGHTTDHGIYVTPNGNNAVIRYNVWYDIPGFAVHSWDSQGSNHPTNQKVYGNLGWNLGGYNPVAAGDGGFMACKASGHRIYNNTLFNFNRGIYAVSVDDVEISNNIFYHMWVAAVILYGDETNSTLTNNIAYGVSPTYGYFNDIDGDTVNTGNLSGDIDPEFITSLTKDWAQPPQAVAVWTDFALGSGSTAIDAGIDLGASYDDSLDPGYTVWPPSLLDQDLHGAGWEMGAFVFADPAALDRVLIIGNNRGF